MSFTEAERQRYQRLISTASLRTNDLVWYDDRFVPRIIAHKARYKAVSEQLNLPLALIPILHTREMASDVGVFNAYLGNGQALNRVTTIAPRGRGPFASWEQGAIDALRLKSLDKVSEWTLERMLWECERYNGFGYRNRGLNSPYVWSHTNHHIRGLFVRDGVFDPNAESKNIGAYALYQLLCAKDPDFAIKGEEVIDGTKISDIEVPQWFELFKELILRLIAVVFGKKETAPVVEEKSITERVWQTAFAEIGVKEIPGAQHHPRILEYHMTTGRFSDDETPWCASFVNWCLAQHNIRGTGSAVARSFLNWGVPTNNPSRGDIVVLWRISPTSWQGHVGFVDRIIGDNVWILGGNQSNQVNIQAYKLNTVLGYRTYR